MLQSPGSTLRGLLLARFREGGACSKERMTEKFPKII